MLICLDPSGDFASAVKYFEEFEKTAVMHVDLELMEKIDENFKAFANSPEAKEWVARNAGQRKNKNMIVAADSIRNAKIHIHYRGLADGIRRHECSPMMHKKMRCLVSIAFFVERKKILPDHVWPVGVEHFAAWLVSALVGVGTEKVALCL